jgi:penicillin-binding protein 1A
MGYPNALISMPGVQGGSYPASIWHDFMSVAHGSDCSDFPQPKEPVDFSPFYGHYSSTGGGSSGSYGGDSNGSYGGKGSSPSGGGTPSTGGGGGGGYDPRLYESPPQAEPHVSPPPPTPAPPSGGGGHGNGGGHGGGNGQDHIGPGN